MSVPQQLLFFFAIIVLPMLFMVLCGKMRIEKVPHPPYIPYFVLFGSLGGWILSHTLFTKMWVMGLVIIASFAIASTAAIIVSLVLLLITYKRTPYHNIALVGSLAYIAYIGTLFFVAKMFV
jgi:hypothetical protein